MNANDVPGEPTTVRSDGASSGPSEDDVFAALADSRRRIAIRTLAEGTEPVAVADVARHVAAVEGDETDLDERADRAYVDLVHVHVPRLVDAGLIEHDRERNAVEGTDALQGVRRVLESFEGRSNEGD